MALKSLKQDILVEKGIVGNNPRFLSAEIIETHTALIDEWEPTHEVWALKYGSYLIGMTCSVSSVMINSLFRRKLRLRSTGQMLTGFVAIIGPAVLASATHNTIIRDDIFLYKSPCPVCYEIKASLLANFNGILYPLVLTPTLNLAIAASLGLRIPYIYQVKEIAKFWWSVVKPAITHLSVAFCFNSVIASVVVYNQFSNISKVRNIVKQVEEYEKKELRSTNI